MKKFLPILLSLLLMLSLTACDAASIGFIRGADDADNGDSAETVTEPEVNPETETGEETAVEPESESDGETDVAPSVGNAPDFTVSLVDGGEFTLSQQRGKVVLINFWATWCGPCVGEMPVFAQLREEYSEEELAIVCVNVAEQVGTVNQFVADNGYTFPIAYDEQGYVGSLYPTDGIPYTVIIDANGDIHDTMTGAMSSESEQHRHLKGMVDAALAG